MSEGSPTVSAYLNAWLQIRKNAKSIHTFRASERAARVFLEAIGDIPLPHLTEDHYSRFLRALKIYGDRTEQLYATLIYGWFVYLSAREIRPVNLAKLKYIRETEQRRPGKRLRPMDKQSIVKLQEGISKIDPNDLTQARARALVVLALESGLRVSELCRLRVGDLDFDQLQGKVVGKGNKQRKFPFTKKSVDAIRFYLNMRRRLEPDRSKGLAAEDVPVFVSHSRRGHSKLAPLDTDTARLDLDRIVTLLVGKPREPITPHVLRHFAGNEFRKKFKDLELVRVLLGHTSIETTKGYMHVDEEEALAAYHREFE